MSSRSSTLDQALKARQLRGEARTELISGIIFIGTSILIFSVLSLAGGVREIESFGLLREAFIAFLIPLVGMGVLAWRGWWHPVMRYINTGLQITLLSTFLYVIVKARGAEFSLSTAIPLMYAMAISITAFRLSPMLSFFAGALSAGQLIALYAWVMRPHLTPEMLATHITLSWPSMIARVVVLLAIGIACAFAARSLLQQTRRTAADQTRIQLLERTFGRLVAPDIAKNILENDDWMTPSRREAVVMFADLKGFTAYSEGKSPEEVAEYLNRCWTVAAAVVEQHGGVINKYMGDGFLAIFGVPMDLPHAEKAAAETASQLQRDLAPILDEEDLSLCIGLNAGPMIVGGIGSEARCEFTVIGSTVNLASRLEGLNRTLSTQCLASETVAGKLQEHWEVESHGGQKVKGVVEAVDVFELKGKKQAE